MNIFDKIKSELDGNTALYSAMTDQQVADELNSVNKPQNVKSLSKSKLLEVIDPNAFGLLNSGDLARLDILTNSGEVNINNANIKLDIESIFSSGSASHTAIYNLSSEMVSRSSEIGINIPTVSLVGWITEVRGA